MAKLSKRPRLRIVRLSSTLLFLAALCASFVGMNADAAQSTDKARPTLGLVNEDLVGQFNGKNYTFGTSFVDRISKDTEYNWVVLSRAVAEKAYKDHSVDAVLYIPQSFTHDILTLRELSPTKATVEYKLQPQADEQADKLLESKITAVVHGFNEGVVKMYYASLADSLAEADGQMHATLSNQEALVAAMTADVQEPFSSTVPNIESFVSNATSLKEINAATIEAQNSFFESASESIAANGKALSDELPKIDEYVKRQQDIAQINTANSNKGIADQATSDLNIYQSQFDGLKTNTLCQLNGVDATGLPEPCKLPDGTVPPNLKSRVGELNTAVANYTTAHNGAVAALVANLTVRIENLAAAKALLIPRPEPTIPTDPAVPTDPSVPTDPTVPTDPVAPQNLVDQAIITSLETEIGALTTTRDSLIASLPAPALGTALTNLDDWNSATTKSIKDASLKASKVSSLEVKDWSSYSSNQSGIYVDGSDDLHTSVTGLISQGAQANSEMSSSSASVPNSSSQFDALLQSATTTYRGAQNIFGGLNGLVTTGNSGLEENQAYYANFTKVLANTRTPGVDTSRIYNFFSAPIDAKNISPERPTVASVADPMSWFDPKLAAVFGGGLLAGVLAMIISGTVRKRKKA